MMTTKNILLFALNAEVFGGFESLQKRYTTQHNGQMCERVSDSLEALYFFKSKEDYFEKMFGATKTDTCNITNLPCCYCQPICNSRKE